MNKFLSIILLFLVCWLGVFHQHALCQETTEAVVTTIDSSVLPPGKPTILFWILTAIALVFVAANMYEAEFPFFSPFFSFVIISAYLLLLYFVAGINLILLLQLYHIHILVFAICYVIIGVIWSCFKWYWYYTDVIKDLNEGKDDWLERIRTDPYYSDITDEDREALKRNEITENVRNKWNKRVDERCPKASHSKNLILFWMIYWPFNIIWFLCSELLSEVFQKIYNHLVGVYDRIAESVKSRAKL